MCKGSLFRALTQFAECPPNHRTFRVFDNASAPHLTPHEFAVVDTADRIPVNGELFLIERPSQNRPRCIVQTKQFPFGENQLRWYVSQLAGFRRVGSFGGIPLFEGLSDGPYDDEHLESIILGRIVGYAQSSFGVEILREAGWKDEAAGNAAFDASFYIDTLLRHGFKPGLISIGGGNYLYGELLPDEYKENWKQEVFPVMEARNKASLADQMLKAECIKRGLVS